MTDFAALRRNMVDNQLRTYDVTDRAILAAIDTVPREVFVPASRRALAYLDQPVPLDELGGAGSMLLTPMVEARMLQTAAIKPGQSLLQFRGGTGYAAAVAVALGASVTLVEPSRELHAAARAALDAAGAGKVAILLDLPQQTFDVVLVSGACERKPSELFDLIADGGRLVCIEGVGRAGRVMSYQRTGAVVAGRPVLDAAAHLLPEFRTKVEFAL